MEMVLTFQGGILKGEGRDRIGQFLLTGQYDLTDGHCHWTKRYLGQHDVFYHGFNEGKGIWGVWEIPGGGISVDLRGGFHIWPEGMADPTNSYLTTAAELPEAGITDKAPGRRREPVPALVTGGRLSG